MYGDEIQDYKKIIWNIKSREKKNFRYIKNILQL